MEKPMPEEFELKAAFVLNFIRLVNWADEGADGQPLRVCAFRNSEFAAAVRRALAGKVVAGRPLSFAIASNSAAAHCRVLVVDGSEYAVAAPALKTIENAPVLTIGNGAGFLAVGGMLELVTQDRKVQFDASLEAVRRTRLDVSAKLLQLSRNLRRGSSGN